MFNIFKHQLDRQIDLDYLELAETIKQVHQPVIAKQYNAGTSCDPARSLCCASPCRAGAGFVSQQGG